MKKKKDEGFADSDFSPEELSAFGGRERVDFTGIDGFVCL